MACGEGILLEHFQKVGFTPTRYLGLDIASAAIDKARVLHPDFRFEVVDAEKYKPDMRFDISVLNECLYYFRRPLKVLRTLESRLAEGGVFVVSVYCVSQAASSNHRYWEDLISRYDCIEHQTITNSKETTWKIGVFRPCGAI